MDMVEADAMDDSDGRKTHMIMVDLQLMLEEQNLKLKMNGIQYVFIEYHASCVSILSSRT